MFDTEDRVPLGGVDDRVWRFVAASFPLIQAVGALLHSRGAEALAWAALFACYLVFMRWGPTRTRRPASAVIAVLLATIVAIVAISTERYILAIALIAAATVTAVGVGVAERRHPPA
ncbi:MAG TPA: hypothetical protein VG871_04065 [Vicinamibacterales bacterium]|nr:hypothetical protein [Vicinamibacterales bacterium]